MTGIADSRAHGPDDHKERLGLRRWGRVAALIATPIVIVVAMWVPFGFSMTGLYEEWAIFGVFSQGGVSFFSGLNGDFASQASRPLLMFPFALSYVLDGNSFYPMNFVLAGVLITQGIAFGFLTRKLTNSSLWSAVGGALVLLQPADTAVYAFRALPTSFSLALALFASCLFWVAWDLRRKYHAILVAVVAGLIMVAASGMYEAALTIIPLPFLLILIRDGYKSVFRRLSAHFWACSAWLVTVPVYLGYAKWISTQTETYQSQVASDPLSAFSRLSNLYSIGLLRVLLGGWVDAAGIVIQEFATYWYLSGAVVILVIVVLVSGAGISQPDAPPRQSGGRMRTGFRLLASGVIMVVFAYSPFLLSAVYQVTSQRTFIFTAPGGAMFFLGILMLVSLRSKVVAFVLACLIGTLGMGAHLFQFDDYVNLSLRQKVLLRGMVDQLKDVNLNGRTVLILDSSNQVGAPWMLHRDNLPATLTYLLDRNVKAVETCFIPSMEWQRWDSGSRSGRCNQDAGGWSLVQASAVTGPGFVSDPVKAPIHLTSDKTVTVRIDTSGHVESSQPVDKGKSPTRSEIATQHARSQGILTSDFIPFGPGMFKPHEGTDHFKWGFGDWWDLPVVLGGSGWRDPEWTSVPSTPRGSFVSPQESSAWKSQEKSSLLFDMEPRVGTYQIDGQFDIILDDRIRHSLAIVINGHKIPIRWTTYSTFSGTVSSGALVDGTNTIQFNSKVKDDYYSLSAKLDGFELNPSKSS